MLEAEPKDDLISAYDSAFDDGARETFIDTAAHDILTNIEWSEK